MAEKEQEMQTEEKKKKVVATVVKEAASADEAKGERASDGEAASIPPPLTGKEEGVAAAH